MQVPALILLSHSSTGLQQLERRGRRLMGLLSEMSVVVLSALTL